MTKKEFEFIKNAFPNKDTDNLTTINGEDPWIAGTKEAERKSKEYF